MNYSAGDIVTQRTYGGMFRRVRVQYREENVNKGQPGFVGDVLDRAGSVIGKAWGYDTQIVKIESLTNKELWR